MLMELPPTPSRCSPVQKPEQGALNPASSSWFMDHASSVSIVDGHPGHVENSEHVCQDPRTSEVGSPSVKVQWVKKTRTQVGGPSFCHGSPWRTSVRPKEHFWSPLLSGQPHKPVRGTQSHPPDWGRCHLPDTRLHQ